MPNIDLAKRKAGHFYDPALFSAYIHSSGAKQDWWVLAENWRKFIHDLRSAVIDASTTSISNLVSNLEKDLPANPGSRFPDDKGHPWEKNYCERVFYRVDIKTREQIDSVSIKYDMGMAGGDTEVNHLSHFLGSTLNNNLKSYKRCDFEKEFNLVWLRYKAETGDQGEVSPDSSNLDVAELQEQIEDLEAELDSLTSKSKDEIAKVQEQVKVISKLEEHVKALEQERDCLTSKSKDAIGKLNEQVKVISELEEHVKALERDLESQTSKLQEQLKALEEERKSQTSKCKEEKAELQEQLKALERDLQVKSTAMIDTLQEQLKALEKERESQTSKSNDDISKLQEQVQALEKERDLWRRKYERCMRDNAEESVDGANII